MVETVLSFGGSTDLHSAVGRIDESRSNCIDNATPIRTRFVDESESALAKEGCSNSIGGASIPIACISNERAAEEEGEAGCWISRHR